MPTLSIRLDLPKRSALNFEGHEGRSCGLPHLAKIERDIGATRPLF